MLHIPATHFGTVLPFTEDPFPPPDVRYYGGTHSQLKPVWIFYDFAFPVVAKHRNSGRHITVGR